jgi:hypothetical protein
MAQVIPAQHGKTIPHVRTEIRVPAYIKNPFQEKYDTDTFPNQRQFAKDIARVFHDKTALHVLAVAPTQSGKTGTMLAIQREFAEQKAIRVKKTHMFIFTGLSSLEWLEQTKNRFPEFMTPHIFHRNQWKKAVTKIHGLTNVLIIIDECHIAAKTQQTLHKFAQHIWNHDTLNMYTKNIKLIQFTATPQLLEQLSLWNKNIYKNGEQRITHYIWTCQNTTFPYRNYYNNTESSTRKTCVELLTSRP